MPELDSTAITIQIQNYCWGALVENILRILGSKHKLRAEGGGGLESRKLLSKHIFLEAGVKVIHISEGGSERRHPSCYGGRASG